MSKLTPPFKHFARHRASLFILICLVIPFLFYRLHLNRLWKIPAEVEGDERQSDNDYPFNLVDPNQAPVLIRASAMRGYQLMMTTPQHAKEYVGANLSCTNCHFSGGNTSGGRMGGISLVGVAAKYPHFDPRSQSIFNLEERINWCFERSLNGKALPLESQEMKDLVVYLHWISKGVPIYSPTPWLELPKLKTERHSDIYNGKRLYDLYCYSCHHSDEESTQPIPPIWGNKSFNDAAGMSTQSKLASFIYFNMPYNDPQLDPDEAADIATFILSQPRPHFHQK